ncbi:hypothetical protein [Roseiconus lacunae]|uniref:hypothetical protein n=1 Tax=Roseiconus lacunae TaxID=2605694 RepID=UPI001E2CAC06|nr:hypothetical protein [Roseiconus lacunae]MCD0457917.1 hypothetical protein [Roseiconus lacunae]
MIDPALHVTGRQSIAPDNASGNNEGGFGCAGQKFRIVQSDKHLVVTQRRHSIAGMGSHQLNQSETVSEFRNSILSVDSPRMKSDPGEGKNSLLHALRDFINRLFGKEHRKVFALQSPNGELTKDVSKWVRDEISVLKQSGNFSDIDDWTAVTAQVTKGVGDLHFKHLQGNWQGDASTAKVWVKQYVTDIAVIQACNKKQSKPSVPSKNGFHISPQKRVVRDNPDLSKNAPLMQPMPRKTSLAPATNEAVDVSRFLAEESMHTDSLAPPAIFDAEQDDEREQIISSCIEKVRAKQGEKLKLTSDEWGQVAQAVSWQVSLQVQQNPKVYRKDIREIVVNSATDLSEQKIRQLATLEAFVAGDEAAAAEVMEWIAGNRGNEDHADLTKGVLTGCQDAVKRSVPAFYDYCQQLQILGQPIPSPKRHLRSQLTAAIDCNRELSESLLNQCDSQRLERRAVNAIQNLSEAAFNDSNDFAAKLVATMKAVHLDAIASFAEEYLVDHLSDGEIPEFSEHFLDRLDDLLHKVQTCYPQPDRRTHGPLPSTHDVLVLLTQLSERDSEDDLLLPPQVLKTFVEEMIMPSEGDDDSLEFDLVRDKAPSLEQVNTFPRLEKALLMIELLRQESVVAGLENVICGPGDD